MKRALFAGAAAFYVLILSTRDADALFGIGDIVSDPILETEQITSNASTAASWATQAKNALEQIRYLSNQLQRAEATYYALAHVTDFASAVTALNALGIRNPLPVNPYAVQGLLNGSGGPQGMLASIGGLYSGSLSSNQVYQVPGGSWTSQEINANGGGIAGAQALAMQLYQSASQRIPLLAQLQGQISTASDPSEREALIARLGVEQASIQTAQLQAQALGNYMAGQYRVREQRAVENTDCQIDQVLLDAQSRGICGNCAAGLSPASCNSQPVGNASPLGYGATFQPVSLTYQNGAQSQTAQSGTGGALDTMLSQPWGNAAAQNAQALGVNPEAIAATCVLESGCQNINSRSGSGANGAFQMVSGTYQRDLQQALQANPNLSATGDRSDPATESIAASQDLRNAALSLAQNGVQNPTVLDARGYYEFGARYGSTLAQAEPSQTMSSLMPTYTPAQLQANGIGPSTTVGAWRQSVIGKLGSSASAPVLSTTNT